MTTSAEDIIGFFENHLRPRIQVDGGDACVSGVEGHVVHVIAGGDCAVCPVVDRGCLTSWLDKELDKRFPGVTVRLTRNVSYFRR